MKKLYKILQDKLDTELDLFEIKQGLDYCEQRKRKQTVENDTGSWTLSRELEGHTSSHYLTPAYTSYADYLTFIKN